MPRWRAPRNTGFTSVLGGKGFEARYLIDELRKCEQKAMRDWKWHGKQTSHPLCESSWRKSHLIVRRWQSAEHKEWRLDSGGFRDLVTTECALMRVSGRWRRADGQWCSLIATVVWDQCTEYMALKRLRARCSVPSRGRSSRVSSASLKRMNDGGRRSGCFYEQQGRGAGKGEEEEKVERGWVLWLRKFLLCCVWLLVILANVGWLA